ncbi:hypothetical protein OO013_02850 [Mangrovivirga sp. M17]|uniref:Peptidase M10 metallopeptidase domain-containing protein n=1 Tax=Mangrovivirga halotolerans TaxID=2993936 RepID=A0ABT3RMI2_9BACT|nr:hypothetical protein [Mangrovivirga halotolerans]MCX2742786.1 hypothetical protein [Mangrovivirga halotolerans]
MPKLFALISMILILACESNEQTSLVPVQVEPEFRDLSAMGINARITSNIEGESYVLYKAEFLTLDESGEMGNTVFFMNTGNKQLGADFVPGLSLDGTNDISYYIDENRPSADLDVSTSSAAVDRAMNTWDDLLCSDLNIFKVPSDPAVSSGFVAFLLGFGGSQVVMADITHCGWLGSDFFNFLAPGGGNFILGVTFTFVYSGPGGPTDEDNNGKLDVAFREIYYNDNFSWFDGGNIDVETVALHEAGHGLSQAHFGKAFLDAGAGKLHFSPRAVMNAGYSGIQTEIQSTDNAGHCSNWANWSNN